MTTTVLEETRVLHALWVVVNGAHRRGNVSPPIHGLVLSHRTVFPTRNANDRSPNLLGIATTCLIGPNTP